MIPAKYSRKLRSVVRQYFPSDRHKAFVFGSALTDHHFQDVDVGILGPVDQRDLRSLRSALEESTFPYVVDIVPFEEVDEAFADSVLHHQNKQWI